VAKHSPPLLSFLFYFLVLICFLFLFDFIPGSCHFLRLAQLQPTFPSIGGGTADSLPLQS
jgi:hypothetical protein